MSIPSKSLLRATSLIAVVVLTIVLGFVLFGARPTSNSAASNTLTPHTTSIANPTSVSLPATASATPSTAPTAIATRTPLPPLKLDPTWTPTPIVPTPVWTPIPPVVTGWTTFTGKSGFSFSYPTGWYVKESLGTHQPENQLAVSISILNYDRANIPPKTIVVPGALEIQLLDFTRGEVPANGTQFSVGPQILPGLQFVYGRDDPRVEPQFRVFERSDSIYFNVGGRRWLISGTIYPPIEAIGKYSEIFYQIVRSLRYETK